MSPSELLMGRKLRTQLPILSENLEQTDQEEQLQGAEKKEEHYRMKQAMNFDDRHKTKLLPQLQRGDNVWIRNQDRDGVVVEKSNNPRSDVVETEKGRIPRNRSALVETPQKKTADSELKTKEKCRSTKTPHHRNVETISLFNLYYMNTLYEHFISKTQATSKGDSITSFMFIVVYYVLAISCLFQFSSYLEGDVV